MWRFLLGFQYSLFLILFYANYNITKNVFVRIFPELAVVVVEAIEYASSCSFFITQNTWINSGISLYHCDKNLFLLQIWL